MLKLVNQPECGDFFYCDKDKYVVLEGNGGDDTITLFAVDEKCLVALRNGYMEFEQLVRGVFSNTNLEKLKYKGKPVFKKELELIPGAVYKDYKNNLWLLTKHQDMYYCVYDNGVVQHGWSALSEERMKEKAINNSWVMLSDSFTKGKHDECK